MKSREKLVYFDVKTISVDKYPVAQIRSLRKLATETHKRAFELVKTAYPSGHWRNFYPILNLGFIPDICCIKLRYVINVSGFPIKADVMNKLQECGWYVYEVSPSEINDEKAWMNFAKSIKNRMIQKSKKEVKPYKNNHKVMALENVGPQVATGSRVEGFELLSLPAQWTERIQIEKLGHKESIEYMDWCVQNVMKHPYYKEFAEYGAFSKNLRLSAINFKNGTRTGKIPYGLITGMWQHMEISVKKINSALKKGLKLSVSIPSQTSGQLPLQTTKPKPEVQFQRN